MNINRQGFISAALQNAQRIPLEQARNWHDRLMGFHKGQGFDMVAIPVIDNQYKPKILLYREGELLDGPVKGAPQKFKSFTGFVEGVCDTSDNDKFYAIIYFDSGEFRTPASSYVEAQDVLGQVGFSLYPLYVIQPNGWNGLRSNVDFFLRDSVSWDFVVFPAQPRLAENGFVRGVQVAIRVANPNRLEEETADVEEDKKPTAKKTAKKKTARKRATNKNVAPTEEKD